MGNCCGGSAVSEVSKTETSKLDVDLKYQEANQITIDYSYENNGVIEDQPRTLEYAKAIEPVKANEEAKPLEIATPPKAAKPTEQAEPAEPIPPSNPLDDANSTEQPKEEIAKPTQPSEPTRPLERPRAPEPRRKKRPPEDASVTMKSIRKNVEGIAAQAETMPGNALAFYHLVEKNGEELLEVRMDETHKLYREKEALSEIILQLLEKLKEEIEKQTSKKKRQEKARKVSWYDQWEGEEVERVSQETFLHKWTKISEEGSEFTSVKSIKKISIDEEQGGAFDRVEGIQKKVKRLEHRVVKFSGIKNSAMYCYLQDNLIKYIEEYNGVIPSDGDAVVGEDAERLESAKMEGIDYVEKLLRVLDERVVVLS